MPADGLCHGRSLSMAQRPTIAISLDLRGHRPRRRVDDSPCAGATQAHAGRAAIKRCKQRRVGWRVAARLQIDLDSALGVATQKQHAPVAIDIAHVESQRFEMRAPLEKSRCSSAALRNRINLSRSVRYPDLVRQELTCCIIARCALGCGPLRYSAPGSGPCSRRLDARRC